MAVTYCADTDVQAVIQKATAFGAGTTPTKTQVEGFINEAEDEIDQRTNHAWRSKIVTDEYYDIPTKGSRTHHFGYPHDGIPIYIRHRNITTFVSGTDKIEVWNGSEWIEWVATKTEGRANDYWMDNERGVLYLRLFWPHFLTKAVRLTYRYGEATVPKDIKKACSLIASIKVLQSDDRSAVLSETGDPTRMTYDNRVTQWQKEVDRIIKNHTDIAVI